jgi:hypothetical protein
MASNAADTLDDVQGHAAGMSAMRLESRGNGAHARGGANGGSGGKGPPSCTVLYMPLLSWKQTALVGVFLAAPHSAPLNPIVTVWSCTADSFGARK